MKERDDAITKLKEELKEKNEECSKLENAVQQHKDKNNVSVDGKRFQPVQFSPVLL